MTSIYALSKRGKDVTERHQRSFKDLVCYYQDLVKMLHVLIKILSKSCVFCQVLDQIVPRSHKASRKILARNETLCLNEMQDVALIFTFVLRLLLGFIRIDSL